MTILADYLRHHLHRETASERVARLLAEPPPPADWREARRQVAAELGVDVVGRAWTGEVSRNEG